MLVAAALLTSNNGSHRDVTPARRGGKFSGKQSLFLQERSERNVSIDTIARIARGLQIEPWRLLKDN